MRRRAAHPSQGCDWCRLQCSALTGHQGSQQHTRLRAMRHADAQSPSRRAHGPSLCAHQRRLLLMPPTTQKLPSQDTARAQAFPLTPPMAPQHKQQLCTPVCDTPRHGGRQPGMPHLTRTWGGSCRCRRQRTSCARRTLPGPMPAHRAPQRKQQPRTPTCTSPSRCSGTGPAAGDVHPTRTCGGSCRCRRRCRSRPGRRL